MQNGIFNQYLSGVNRFANIKIKDQLLILILKSTSIKKRNPIQFFLKPTVALNPIYIIRNILHNFFFTSLYRDRTHTELNLLEYVNHQYYTSPSSKYRHQRGEKGREEGGEGQAQVAGLYY